MHAKGQEVKTVEQKKAPSDGETTEQEKAPSDSEMVEQEKAPSNGEISPSAEKVG